MEKKLIRNKVILKESVEWSLLHRKLIVIVALCYLGMIKIMVDLPFYDPDKVNMIHSLGSFNFNVFFMDLIEYMLLLFLVYVMVIAVTMTLNHRPLTINAVSIALNRKKKKLLGISIVVGLIATIMSMALTSLVLWLDASYWLSEFFILFLTASFSLFFVFFPHEIILHNTPIFKALVNGFKLSKFYFKKLLALTFCLGFIHSIFNEIVSYFLLPTNYFYRVLTGTSDFVLIIVAAVVVTIFYYDIKNKKVL